MPIRKIETQIKRAKEKFSDVSKEIDVRFRHLRFLCDVMEEDDLQKFLEAKKTIAFLTTFDYLLSLQFLQKYNKDQEKELRLAFDVLEVIMRLLPHFIHLRWHAHSILTLMRSFITVKAKLRSRIIYCFVMWYQTLNDNACEAEHQIFANLIPEMHYDEDQRSGKVADINKAFVPQEVNDLFRNLLDAISKTIIATRWLPDNGPELLNLRRKSFRFMIFKLNYYYASRIFAGLFPITDALFDHEKRDDHVNVWMKRLMSREDTGGDENCSHHKATYIRWMCRFLQHPIELSTPDRQLDVVDVTILDTSDQATQIVTDDLAEAYDIGRSELLSEEINLSLCMELLREACSLKLDKPLHVLCAIRCAVGWLKWALIRFPTSVETDTVANDSDGSGLPLTTTKTITTTPTTTTLDESLMEQSLQLFIVYTGFLFVLDKDVSEAQVDSRFTCCTMVMRIYERFIGSSAQKFPKVWNLLFKVANFILETLLKDIDDGWRQGSLMNKNSLLQLSIETTLKLFCKTIAYQVNISASLWKDLTSLLVLASDNDLVVEAWTHVLDRVTRAMCQSVFKIDINELNSNGQESSGDCKGGASTAKRKFRLTETVQSTQPKSHLKANVSRKSTFNSISTRISCHKKTRSFSDSIAHIFHDEAVAACGGSDRRVEYAILQDKIPEVASIGKSEENTVQLLAPPSELNVVVFNHEELGLVETGRNEMSQNSGDGHGFDVYGTRFDDYIHMLDRPDTTDCLDVHSDMGCDSLTDVAACNTELDDSDTKFEYSSPQAVVHAWHCMLSTVGRCDPARSSTANLAIINKMANVWFTMAKVNEEVLMRQMVAGNNMSAVCDLFILFPLFCDTTQALVSLAQHSDSLLVSYEIICSMIIYPYAQLPSTVFSELSLVLIYNALSEKNQELMHCVVRTLGGAIYRIPKMELLIKRIISACAAIFRSGDYSAPYKEAATILGSLCCFPRYYDEIQVLMLADANNFILATIDSHEFFESLVSTATTCLRYPMPSDQACNISICSITVMCAIEILRGNLNKASQLLMLILERLERDHDSATSCKNTAQMLEFLAPLMTVPEFAPLCRTVIEACCRILEGCMMIFLQLQKVWMEEYLVQLVLAMLTLLVYCRFDPPVFQDQEEYMEIEDQVTQCWIKIYQVLQADDTKPCDISIRVYNVIKFAFSYLSCDAANDANQTRRHDEQDWNECKYISLGNDTILSFRDESQDECEIVCRQVCGKFRWTCKLMDDDIPETTSPERFQFRDCFLPIANLKVRRKQEVTDNEVQKNSDHLRVPMPGVTSKESDFMLEILRFVSRHSPRCLMYDQPTTRPAPLPSAGFDSQMMEELRAAISHQCQIENECWRTRLTPSDLGQRRQESGSESKLKYPSRAIINRLGLLHRRFRNEVKTFEVNDQLHRELKHLDNTLVSCETHKIAVLYVGEHDNDRNQILGRTVGSDQYEQFLSDLGDVVDLFEHEGFMGGLTKPQGPGVHHALYCEHPMIEIMFHVSTLMARRNVLKTADEGQQADHLSIIRHIGNDEVQIVWCDGFFKYNRSLLCSTEFADVLIVIQPMDNGMYRISVDLKEELPFFGPLFNGCIIRQELLSHAVRQTAINASRTRRSTMPSFEPFYEQRLRHIEDTIKNIAKDNGFDKFILDIQDCETEEL